MTKAPDGVKKGGGWGSHQPALMAFAKFMKVRSVIEFGAGLFSTHLFLDRDEYPDLISLVTFEHDNKWAEKVRVDDKRHNLIIISHEKFAERSEGMKADLVFLDNGPSFRVRFGLVKHAMTLAPVLAIHDCNIGDLTSYKIKYIKTFNTKIQTAFVSNTVDLSGLEL